MGNFKVVDEWFNTVCHKRNHVTIIDVSWTSVLYAREKYKTTGCEFACIKCFLNVTKFHHLEPRCSKNTPASMLKEIKNVRRLYNLEIQELNAKSASPKIRRKK